MTAACVHYSTAPVYHAGIKGCRSPPPTLCGSVDFINPWINCRQPRISINQREICEIYTTRPGAPTVVNDKHDQKVHT